LIPLSKIGYWKGRNMSILEAVTDSARNLLVSGEQRRTIDAIAQVLDERALAGGLSGLGEADLIQQAQAVLEGYGPLQELIDDPDIEEIWSNRPNEVFVARGLEVSKVEIHLSEKDLKTILLRMLRFSGRRVDRTLPFADAALPDGSRLHIVIPEITSAHWTFNLRKFPKRIMTLAELVELGSLTDPQAIFLRNAVTTGENILISGATHSGKTTLLCALLNELSDTTRLVTCEETFEIRTNLRDWVAMQTRQPNLEGQGEIHLRRLVKEALRMRPGYLVIGEVREAEALELLIAMNSGISGMCTIHANSTQLALTKLSTLPLLAGSNISSDFVTATVANAVGLVVQCSNQTGIGRKVTQISKVRLSDTGYLEAQDIQL
jgi:pilus assembly protein CpaF